MEELNVFEDYVNAGKAVDEARVNLQNQEDLLVNSDSEDSMEAEIQKYHYLESILDDAVKTYESMAVLTVTI